TLLLGWVVSVHGWRWGFYTAGVLGLVWLVGWLVWYRGPETATFIDEDERALILRERDSGAKAQGSAQGSAEGFGVLLRSRSMIAVAVTQG
ncbi:hypothetical protein ABTL03_19440, partial [Acinetobacter baumannii]